MGKKICQRAKPCPTCPYLRSTPSGIWHRDHYLMLKEYDQDHQPMPSVATFLCHYSVRGLKEDTFCQGWLDCHGADQLLAIRLRAIKGELPENFSFEPSGAEVYGSGKEACEAGLRDIEEPGLDASYIMRKLNRMRVEHERVDDGFNVRERDL